MAKVNWSKALADYLKDETESYASIARKHGVSLQAVKKRAGKEGWVNLRQKSIQKVNQELPELVGESVADINARHAQFGKLLQSIAIHEMREKDLKPKNFMEALRAVGEGIKIERKVIENIEERQPKTNIFNTSEFAKRYAFVDSSGKTNEPRRLITSSIQKPTQVVPSTSAVDPQLLAKIQEGLSRISERLDEVKYKLETKKTENTSANDRLTGWF